MCGSQFVINQTFQVLTSRTLVKWHFSFRREHKLQFSDVELCLSKEMKLDNAGNERIQCSDRFSSHFWSNKTEVDQNKDFKVCKLIACYVVKSF